MQAHAYTDGRQIICLQHCLSVSGTKIDDIKNLNKKWFTYRVFLAITTDSDLRSRYGRIHKVADGYWRFVWLTSVDSEDVVAFTHGHGTVTWYVVLQTRLGTNVYLHHRQVVSHMTKLTTIIFHKRRLTIVHSQQTPICNCNNCQTTFCRLSLWKSMSYNSHQQKNCYLLFLSK